MVCLLRADDSGNQLEEFGEEGWRYRMSGEMKSYGIDDESIDCDHVEKQDVL